MSVSIPSPHMVLRVFIISLLLSLSGVARAEGAEVRTTWRLLDYIAVDYSAAVSNGQVIDDFEYSEMVEFSSGTAAFLVMDPYDTGKFESSR